MGLGKTRQAIVSLQHLTPGGRRLVVCPASVKRNWAREIALVSPDTSTLVIDGTSPVSPTAEWIIIDYDILGRHIDDLLTLPWAALVFDEAGIDYEIVVVDADDVKAALASGEPVPARYIEMTYD